MHMNALFTSRFVTYCEQNDVLVLIEVISSIELQDLNNKLNYNILNDQSYYLLKNIYKRYIDT